jgi:hypothetical protein
VFDLGRCNHDIQEIIVNRTNWHSVRNLLGMEKESTIWCGEIEVDQRAPKGLDAATDVE